jgi:serine/threonine protein kinase
MLTKAGTKLLDFGLARETGPARPASSPGEPAPTVAMGLTAEGMILGTVPYMAPEQVEGRGADARSDVWSFGCLLYEMVTGAPPFTGQSPASLMAAILEHEPEPISRRMAAAPPMLERIIATCLRKDPADRWQSARDLLHELGWLASGLSGELAAPAPSRPPRPWQLALAAAGLAVLALAVGWALGRRGAASVPARRAGPPVIVLMDSTHPQRVYDDDTRKAGGTNADDLTDLLRDLPVSLVKETTNVQWHRESQVLQEDPDLIVVHRSCFFDATYFPDPAASEQTYPFAADKFEMFIGLVGTSNPRTRFLVYSRKSWKDAAERDRWVGNLERRFPVLKGRVRAWSVPLDRTSFRHPATGAEIKAQVGELLPKG